MLCLLRYHNNWVSCYHLECALGLHLVLFGGMNETGFNATIEYENLCSDTQPNFTIRQNTGNVKQS